MVWLFLWVVCVCVCVCVCVTDVFVQTPKCMELVLGAKVTTRQQLCIKCGSRSVHGNDDFPKVVCWTNRNFGMASFMLVYSF